MKRFDPYNLKQTMTVFQLRGELSRFPDDAPVIIEAECCERRIKRGWGREGIVIRKRGLLEPTVVIRVL